MALDPSLDSHQENTIMPRVGPRSKRCSNYFDQVRLDFEGGFPPRDKTAAISLIHFIFILNLEKCYAAS
jgi:hypothetical protein